MVKLNIFCLVLTLSFFSSCVPEPSTLDLTPEASLGIISGIPYGQCLFAGKSNTVANSGILACNAFTSLTCSRTLFPQNVSERNQITSGINALGVQYSNCLAPAGNALTEINSLNLPASYYMNKAGGTPGPHTQGIYYAGIVSDCGMIGLTDPSFLGGAQRIATSDELAFLSSPAGLIAEKDLAGTCQSQMGLSASQMTLITGIQSNSIARSTSCYYGAIDGTKTHCPASLQNANYMFNGISSW